MTTIIKKKNPDSIYGQLDRERPLIVLSEEAKTMWKALADVVKLINEVAHPNFDFHLAVLQKTINEMLDEEYLQYARGNKHDPALDND